MLIRSSLSVDNRSCVTIQVVRLPKPRQTKTSLRGISHPVSETSGSRSPVPSTSRFTCTSLHDHQYCLESPRKLKLKYDVALKRLHQKQQQLYNAKKRERRKEKNVSKLLDDIKLQQMLTDDAQKQLAAYASMNASLCYSKDVHGTRALLN